MNKKEAFFKNAQLLQDTLGITPLMYGSLGLEYLTGKDLNADDIDILIPATFLEKRWDEFCAVLENDGYVLVDQQEHTFEKDSIDYSYAQIEELESFADIPAAEIQTVIAQSISFKLLSLDQYLKVYSASAKDGYRANVRGKKDYDKIIFIQEQLKAGEQQSLMPG